MENKIILKSPWWGKSISIPAFLLILSIAFLVVSDLRQNAQTMSPLLLILSPIFIIGEIWFAFWILQLAWIHEIELDKPEKIIRIHKIFQWVTVKVADIERVVFWEQQKANGVAGTGFANNIYFLHLVLKNGHQETIRLTFNKTKSFYLKLFQNFFGQEIHYRYLRRFEHPNLSTWI